MAKMNKTEAIDAAKYMARNCPGVNDVTVEQLASLNYMERCHLATALMETTAVKRIDTQERYLVDAERAFSDAALNIWHRKEKDLENARREFKRACTGLTADEARLKIADLFRAMNIRGADVSDYGDRLEVRRGRCSVTLYVRMQREDHEGVRNPDNDRQRAGSYALSVEIGTSGTTYSLPEMAVVNKIHAEVLEAANELLVVMASEQIVWTWGIEEPAAAEVNS